MDKDIRIRASHTCPHFKEENVNLYYYIEGEIKTTSYYALINPCQKNNNGRDSFIALVAQYAGEYKWQIILKYRSEILHNQRWSGQGASTLDRFIPVHCNSYVMMTQFSDRVDYQLPNELTCLNFLINAIK